MSLLKSKRRIMAIEVERWNHAIITAAQVLALNATARVIVPAPKSGFHLVFLGALIHKPAGTAYSGIAAGEDLSIKYTDGSGAEVAQCEATGFLDQATAQTRWVFPQAAASGVNGVAVVSGAALVLHLLAGEITTGDSPLRVRTFYLLNPDAV